MDERRRYSWPSDEQRESSWTEDADGYVGPRPSAPPFENRAKVHPFVRIVIPSGAKHVIERSEGHRSHPHYGRLFTPMLFVWNDSR